MLLAMSFWKLQVFSFAFGDAGLTKRAVGDGQGDDRCGSAGRWCDGQDHRTWRLPRIQRARQWADCRDVKRCKLGRKRSQLVRSSQCSLKKGTISLPSLSLKPLRPLLPLLPLRHSSLNRRKRSRSKRRQSRKRGNSRGTRESTMNTRRSSTPSHCSRVSPDCACFSCFCIALSHVVRLQESSLSTDEISKLKGTGRHGMLTKGDVLLALGKVKNRYGSAEKFNVDVMGPSGKRLSEREGVAREVKKEEVLDGPALRRLVVSGMAKATQPAHAIIHHGSSNRLDF